MNIYTKLSGIFLCCTALCIFIPGFIYALFYPSSKFILIFTLVGSIINIGMLIFIWVKKGE